MNRGARECLTMLAIVVFGLRCEDARAVSFSVATTEWEDYTLRDGTGLYFDPLNEIFGKEGYLRIFAPWKRAQFMFRDGEADALLGEDGARQGFLYPRWPCDVNRFSVFYRKSDTKRFSADLLKSRTTVWVRGYDVGIWIKGIGKHIEVSDVAQGMKLVVSGRADFFIDFADYLNAAMERQKISRKQYAIAEDAVDGGFLFLAFHDDARGRHLAREYDEGMERLRRSGRLRAIFERWKRIPAFDAVVQEADRRKIELPSAPVAMP